MAFSRALQGSRTPNLLIRSQTLYPIELGMPLFNNTKTVSCARQGSRTPNLLIRSQMLYPIELGALGNQNKSVILFRFGDANIDIFIDLTNIFSLFLTLHNNISFISLIILYLKYQLYFSDTDKCYHS